MARSLFNKTFYDGQGKLAILAWPNLPIMVWAVSAVLAHFFTDGWPHSALSMISLVAIVIWALLEIFKGVNYFRRALGLIVLALTLYSQFFRCS